MIYPYKCHACGRKWEVIRSVRHIDLPADCACGQIGERYIGRTHFYGASDWDSAQFNPAFGKVIRNKSHLKAELKEAERDGREMIEIGNESLDTIHKHAEETQKRIRDDRWRKVDEELGLHE